MKEIGEISGITFDQMKTSQITLETFLKTNVLDKYQLNYQMLIKWPGQITCNVTSSPNQIGALNLSEGKFQWNKFGWSNWTLRNDFP